MSLRRLAHRQGGFKPSAIASLDTPAIAANEVLVEVRAAGVDWSTGHLLAGLPYLMRIIGFGFSRPKQTDPVVFERA